MSPETQEFGAIYSEIKNEFAGDPVIEVTPVVGDPPSQYEVTYNLPSAVRDAQGEISIANRHIITISIPFGFPHFSPSCKPKSPVFHPDFDTAAICLGSYWNRERRLPELIRHIAKMLRGELYSTDNAFNEEAVFWFNEHSKDLPFSSSVLTDTDSEPELRLEAGAPESEEIDVLEDDDFLDNLDFTDEEDLSVENEAPPAIPAEKGDQEFNSASLLNLAALKKFHQLNEKIHALPPSADFPEKEELESRLLSALNEARELYSIAEDFEDFGNSQKALDAFREVRELVADFPNINDDISRTEQSAAMLREINSNQEEAAETPPVFGEDFDFQQPDTVTETPAEKEVEEEKESPRFFEESSKRSFNIVPLVAVGAILCVIVTLTYYYFSLTSKLTEAKQLFSECTSNFAGKQFHAVEKSCGASLDITKSIFLVHRDEVEDLQLNIQKILDSEELRQGLLGNVLYNGRYVPRSLLEAHQSFFEARTQGDAFFQSSLWDKAISSYQNAINIARRTRDIPPAELLEIEKNLKTAIFRTRLQAAENSMKEGMWEEATTQLNELESELSNLDPAVLPGYTEKVLGLLAKARFSQLKLKADKLFSESDWEGAFSMFERTIEAGRKLSETEPQDLDNLQQNIAKAELYAKINAGNTAFASGKLDLAIKEYETAKSILDKYASLMNLSGSQHSHQKIDRIILQSAILRDRQASERFKEEDAIHEALQKLEEIIANISSSSFSDDLEFQKILTETKQAQQALREDLFIKERIRYLMINYADLFIENYPAASKDSLGSPRADFLKMINNRYLFQLECTETRRGRPLKLIMFYTYDPAAEKWQFYSENR